MAVKATAAITLSTVVDVTATFRYYLLQSSTLNPPAKPASKPPGGSWADTEPAYTSGSTNTLYFTDLTVFSDGTWSYSSVSRSSSYEAAKEAYNKAIAAEDAAEGAQESVDMLTVGGRNYVLQSNAEAESSDYLVWEYEASEPLEAGEQYTLSLCATPASGVTAYGIWLSAGSCKQCEIPLTGTDKQTSSSTFIAAYSSGKTPDNDPVNANIRVYRLPSPGSGTTVNVSKVHWVKIEKGNRATDWTAAPEDAEESLELKLAAVHAQIGTEADSIRSEVQARYALSSDMSQVREQIGTLAEQTENNYTWSVTRISELQNDLTAATEATEEQLNILKTYMTFGEDGLVIGKTGNPFTFRVVNDRLAFYMNNTEVAYLSNNKLYVTQAEILAKLIIGKFAFEPQANGNLSVIYTG